RVQALVDDLLRTGRRCFVVVEGGRVVGLITPHEVKETPRASWGETTVAQAMRPLERLRTVSPDSPVADVLEGMARGDIHQLPVGADGRLERVVRRGCIRRT